MHWVPTGSRRCTWASGPFAFPGGARGEQPQSLSLTPQPPICHLSAEGGGLSWLCPSWLPVGSRAGPGGRVWDGACHTFSAQEPAMPWGRLPDRPVGEAGWALEPAGGPQPRPACSWGRGSGALLSTHTSPPTASSGTQAPAHLHSPCPPARPHSLAATTQQPLWPQPGPGRPPPRGP